ncbi:DeoR family transcriptional regulator [Streptomyces sp. NPDC001833]|uniref:DeoR family transcriptional regulator n=1 Tax=Streptomyces sp. NPDC001833 TaxID=3154658 RepID=UPI0033335E46
MTGAAGTRGSVTTPELTERLRVSAATVRGDVRGLARRRTTAGGGRRRASRRGPSWRN